MHDEGRDTQRSGIPGSVPAEMMRYQPMAVCEISVGGATVETEYPLHLGSLHDLKLTLGQVSVILKGRVVHSRIADIDQDAVTYRSGLEFVDVPERVAAAVADYVAALSTAQSGV